MYPVRLMASASFCVYYFTQRRKRDAFRHEDVNSGSVSRVPLQARHHLSQLTAGGAHEH